MNYQLELKNIYKSYGDVKASQNVSMQIRPQSIHALLGENGAGKSTLVNILYGLVQKDHGQVMWQDEEVNITSPNFAKKLGIGIVFQHFALFEALTVAENIALGIGYKGTMKKLNQHIKETSIHYKLNVYPDRLISELSTGEKQRVEIVRCLLQDPKLLILDEPTSVLTPVETEHLFVTLRQLNSEGRSILFIGHKLNEIKAICETATVIRHGQLIEDGIVLKDLSVDKIAQKMVGSKIIENARREATEDNKVILKLHHKFKKSDFKIENDFYCENLELKAGKITGIAGIAGNGQDQLMSYLAGEKTDIAKNIEYDGQFIGDWNSKQRNQAGILFVPTERLGRSAVPKMSLCENTLLGISDNRKFVNNHLINQQKLAEFADEIINNFDVKTENNQTLASSLSGGNLQKFIVGRAVLQSPKVLLIANPTWGVDIAAAIFIRNNLLRLRQEGTAILVASEDLDELFLICDEIAVILDGRLGETEAIENLTVDKVGLLMTK